jgi:hypothetical protein
MAAPAPQKLTANRLKDGVVVYWKHGAWVEALADGEVLTDNAEAALAAAQASVADNSVVGTYLFDLRADGSPVKEREIIRAAGPSVREDLGKQALGPHPKNASRFSTSPQGGGDSRYLDEPDVSI